MKKNKIKNTSNDEKLDIVSKKIWLEYLKNNPLPEGIPINPDEVWGDKWEGWFSFLRSIYPKLSRNKK